MFSLIISIIAIALAAILLLTSAFYGGSALTTGTAKAKAAALANEAQQVSSAYDLFLVEKGISATSTEDLIADNYLKANLTGWRFYSFGLDDSGIGISKFAESQEVCDQLNINASTLGNGVTCDTDVFVAQYVVKNP